MTQEPQVGIEPTTARRQPAEFEACSSAARSVEARESGVNSPAGIEIAAGDRNQTATVDPPIPSSWDDRRVAIIASPGPRRNAGRTASSPLGERMRDLMCALQRASQACWRGSFDADAGDHAAAARELAEGWAHVERVRAEADALALALALALRGEVASGA